MAAATVASVAALLAACGGGGHDGAFFFPASSAPAAPDAPGSNAASVAIGGTVTGLAGTLRLQNNGGDDLVIGADGVFSFATRLSQGAGYDVSILSKPRWQDCGVAGGRGTANADVTGVSVNCSNHPATVSTFVPMTGDLVGAAFDDSGVMYVTDFGAGTLRKITPGGAISTVATGLGSPVGIAVAPSGDIYVAESGSNRIAKVTQAGAVSTFAGSGASAWADGVGTAASFMRPFGLAIDPQGNLFVSDFDGHRIRKITPLAEVTTVAGTGMMGHADGPGANASFNQPALIALDSAGTLYVADKNSNRIRKIGTDGEVSTLAGDGTAGAQDGPGTTATFNSPYGILASRDGNIYVSDNDGQMIRRVSPSGVVTTVAGSGAQGYSDGDALTIATFYYPAGLAENAAGDIFVVEEASQGIRMISPQ